MAAERPVCSLGGFRAPSTVPCAGLDAGFHVPVMAVCLLAVAGLVPGTRSAAGGRAASACANALLLRPTCTETAGLLRRQCSWLVRSAE